jgi:sortase (surface protein transpeptidase)
VTVTVAAAGIEVPVVEVGVDGQDFMELPEDPAVAGWYKYGSDPSSSEGRTVISAHVDAPAYPIGPFSRLRDVAAGTEVVVADAQGATHRYAVQSVTNYRKTALPVQEIFARTGPAELVLITCGGPFDPTIGRYEDNVVVVATPIR